MISTTGKWRFCLPLIALFLALANPKAAQSQVQQPSESPAPPTQQQTQAPAPQQTQAPAEPEQKTAAELIGEWNGILDTVQQALTRDGLNDQDLAKLSLDMAGIETKARALAAQFAPEVKALSEQLKQLGEPPESGEEAPEIKERRAALQKQKADLEAQQKEAGLVAVRAQQLDGQILKKRRDRFVRSLTDRTANIANPNLWQTAAGAMPGYWKSLRLLFTDSYMVTLRRFSGSPGDLLRMLTAVLIGGLAYIYLARFLQRFLKRRQDSSETESKRGLQRRAGMHLADFGITAVLPIAFFYYLYSTLVSAGFSTDRLHQFFAIALGAFSLIFVTTALARIYLRPYVPHWRIAEVTDQQSWAIFRLLFTGMCIIAALRVINSSSALMFAPIEVPIAASALAALTGLLTGIRAMFLLNANRDEDDEPAPGQNLLSWSKIRPLIWLALFIVAVALLFGYVALAEFVVLQIIVSLTVLALLWLVLWAFEQFKQRILARESNTWKRMTRATGMKAATSRQVAVLSFGLLKLLAFLLAVTAILLPWGVLTQDWFAIINRAFFGFQIGGLTISVSSVLTVFAIFIIGYLITRSIQRWMSSQFLPTTKLDSGMRNSITTVFGYVGIVIAAILAISTAGLDLSQLAIVFGALGVGIGFGLQSIVNNFVSGLILLAERPIKNGDWVVTGGGQGTVKRISVRSTEIETFDGATVILPNSTLITDAVTNWTHRNTMGRVIVTVGVGYNSDADQVRDILLSCATEHELVLEDPAPAVYFMDYGADALIFDLRCYLADIGYMLSVSSDMRFEALRKLRAAGIEIPFAQRDLHIRSVPESLEKAFSTQGKPARSSPAKTASATRRKRTPKTAARQKDME